MNVVRRCCGLLIFCCLIDNLWAGGSGLNVAVVVNQSSSNSVQLGNYYCEQRQVPPQNYLRINWPVGNSAWSIDDFNTNLSAPLLAMLSNRGLTNQIDYVVLSMDIPYEVTSTDSVNPNSTTSALFYGYKPDSNSPCSIAVGSTNLYAGSEGLFRSTPPINATSNSFLVTMITSSNLTLARQLVDSGVTGDATFPTQTAYLVKSDDVERNVRYVLFDNAIFNTSLRGNYTLEQTNAISTSGFGNILGAETGYFNYPVYGESFAPGSMVDNLTSYGGGLFGTDHLDILALLGPGAAGGYGTVSEPCNYLAKFPNPLNYFYQARGFSLAECFYQSITNPYQGILVGEPLTAPFAQPAAGSWNGLPANARLTGTTNLSLQFNAADTNHPLQKVDLFLDGVFAQTLTNLPPAPNDVLYVTLNGNQTNYTVVSGDTLGSIASNLTATLNQSTFASHTKITAFAHGDRIELQSTALGTPGSQVSISVSNSAGGTTFIAASGSSFLDSIASGMDRFQVNSGSVYPPPVGAWLLLTITKTNGVVVKIGVTNTVSSTTIPVLVSNLLNQVNANALLTADDGVVGQDFIDYSVVANNTNSHLVTFNLLARSRGWNAAQIQAGVASDSPLHFSIKQSASLKLDENLGDLQPRAHLYVTAGATNLLLSFPFNTAAQTDGFHDLTAVVYEGSHVRTQRRITQNVCITNNALFASLTPLFIGTNVQIGATLGFSVAANTSGIGKIELFSTGGFLGSVTGQATATFSIVGTNLGIGLHPFYALVTAANGQQYRTQTQWIRLGISDSAFALSLTAPPPTLLWPATVGRGYDVLTTTNLVNGFESNTTLTATNSPAQWTDTNPGALKRFYRVRTSQ